MEPFNWIAIIVAAAMPLVFGGLWYSNPVYSAVTGEKPGNRKHGPVAYIACFLLSIPLAVSLGVVHSLHDPVEQVCTHGITHGIILGLMVASPVLAVHFIFEGDRSWRNAAYHIVYWVISIALIGAAVFGLS